LIGSGREQIERARNVLALKRQHAQPTHGFALRPHVIDQCGEVKGTGEVSTRFLLLSGHTRHQSERRFSTQKAPCHGTVGDFSLLLTQRSQAHADLFHHVREQHGGGFHRFLKPFVRLHPQGREMVVQHGNWGANLLEFAEGFQAFWFDLVAPDHPGQVGNLTSFHSVCILLIVAFQNMTGGKQRVHHPCQFPLDIVFAAPANGVLHFCSPNLA